MLNPMILLILAATPDPYESALVAAVHHFAREGNLDHLKAILDRHPRLVDAYEPFPQGHKPLATEGYTPLDWAAVRGRSDVAGYLIRRGANVKAADGAGWTPLHLAARNGHLDVVKLLVKHGANVEATTEAAPETSSDSLPGSPGLKERALIFPAIPKRTALDWAKAMEHAEVVRYLESRKK